MKNSSYSTFNRSNAMWENPKAMLFQLLIKECFSGMQNHSEIYSYSTPPDEDGYWCPRVFDGFACWDETPATAIAYQPCPYIVLGFDTTRFAYKFCTENGTWYRKPGNKYAWSNYTDCVSMDELRFRIIVSYVYMTGYITSLFFVGAAVAIFSYFKPLKCAKTTIHIHFFVALSFSNVCWTLWYQFIVNDVDVIANNGYVCQIFHVINQYFTLTTYGWMFCEGLHLHLALVIVFVNEDSTMKKLMFIGWGLPGIVVIIYAGVRYHIPEDAERCWIDDSSAQYVIIVPVILSLVISVVFLLNVGKVLIDKLRNGQHLVNGTWKTLRAACLLIPLYGVQFFLIPFRPSPNAKGERVYQLFSAFLIGFQGACVSLLFCFTNKDVYATIKAHFARTRANRRAIPMTGITAAAESVAPAAVAEHTV